MAAEREEYVAFFTSEITILQTLVVALGAGLAVWGVIMHITHSAGYYGISLSFYKFLNFH